MRTCQRCRRTQRKQPAVERTAREREQRLAQALSTMDKLQRKPLCEPQKPKASKRRARGGDYDPGAHAAKPQAEPRLSTTDADACVMKMVARALRPAFNAPLPVDADMRLTAAAAICNGSSDTGQMRPMHQDTEQTYAATRQHWLAEGGFTALQAIDKLTRRGTQPVVLPPRSRHPNIDCLATKDSDSPTQAQWRTSVASDFAEDLYVQRGATAECTNAQLSRRGLHRFNVRGLRKACAVMLWRAPAHNLMRMRGLNFAFSA